MIAENKYISLKGMSRQQRDALRESFLRAYARNGKVAENARVFSIRLCTAQGWVNRYTRDGRKFRNEHVSGRKIGMCRTLTPDEIQWHLIFRHQFNPPFSCAKYRERV